MFEEKQIIKGKELLGTLEEKLERELASFPLAKNLLLAQINIIKNRDNFKGIHLSQEKSSKTAGYFDRKTEQLHLILGSTNPISNTASHEIIHAIEFLDGIKSEEKVEAMLRKLDLTKASRIAKEFLPKNLKEEFGNQINNPSKTLEKFYQEIGSYVFESIFDNMITPGNQGVRTFTDRFGEFIPHEDITKDPEGRPVRGRPTYDDKVLKSQVQEIIAVSIYEINQVIIDSISDTEHDFRELKGYLSHINDFLTPAYQSAQGHYPELWTQEAATLQAGIERSAEHSTMPSANTISSPPPTSLPGTETTTLPARETSSTPAVTSSSQARSTDVQETESHGQDHLKRPHSPNSEDESSPPRSQPRLSSDASSIMQALQAGERPSALQNKRLLFLQLYLHARIL